MAVKELKCCLSCYYHYLEKRGCAAYPMCGKGHYVRCVYSRLETKPYCCDDYIFEIKPTHQEQFEEMYLYGVAGKKDSYK